MLERFGAKRVGLVMVVFACSVASALAACVGDSSNPPDAGDGSTTDTTASETGSETGSDAFVGTDGDAAKVTTTDIAAGASHACALDSNGGVYCWGDNTYGAVGVATSKNTACVGSANVPAGCIASPTLVSGITATKIAAGRGFTCAVDGAHDVWCWGVNTVNQLGHATGVGDSQCTAYSTPDASAPYACNPTPQKVAGVSGVADITAGAAHACARTMSNAVYCWGNNTLGELGNVSAGASTATPTQPTGLPPVIEVRAGYDYDTCAVAVSGGGVWCWGFDDWGQLDVQNADYSCGSLCSNVPRRAVWLDGGAMQGANHVAVAHSYTCATFGTTATCWGLDFTDIISQTGTNPGPIVVSDPTGLEMRWESQCTLVGGRTCWGDNSAGALGDGTFGPDGGILATPEALTSPSNVSKLSGGVNFYLALTTANVVYAWGANYAGVLGHAQQGGSPPDVTCEGSSTYCNATPQKVSGLP